MKKSFFFSDLSQRYNEELDDLLTDSEGKTVLNKRLNDKRQAIASILPMIEFSPEMVAVAFYGAFNFKSTEIMQQIVLSHPGDTNFLPWAVIQSELTIATWATPLITAALAAPGGDDFLVATAALEFLRQKDKVAASLEALAEDANTGERGDEDDDEAHDLSEAGEQWLSEQGFDRLDA